MGGLKSKITVIALSTIWLCVLFGAAALSIARRDEQGIFSYLAVGMAVVMLVLFVVGYLPRRLKKKSLAGLVDKLFVGLLLLFAISIIAATLITGYRDAGLLGNGFLILFLVTFIRIFINYVKHVKKEMETKRGENTDGGEVASEAEEEE